MKLGGEPTENIVNRPKAVALVLRTLYRILCGVAIVMRIRCDENPQKRPRSYVLL